MRLRNATTDDLPRLEAWSIDFEHRDPPEPPFVAQTLAELTRRPERGELLVLETDRGPAGYAILQTFWSNEFRGEAVILDELYIAPEHRGGTGALALAAIEARVRARGVRLLALEVLPGEGRAHGLYRRAGFTSGRTLYQKRLSGRPLTEGRTPEG